MELGEDPRFAYQATKFARRRKRQGSKCNFMTPALELTSKVPPCSLQAYLWVTLNSERQRESLAEDEGHGRR